MANSFPCKFGPYILVEMLGTSGMGEMVLALAGQLDKEKLYVVRRLAPELRSKAQAKDHFRREGQLSLRLSHGTIAQTLAVGELEGEPYLVQEFIEGRDLIQLQLACASDDSRISTELSIHIVCEIARALSYVDDLEGLRLVNREISPANIRLAYSGEVKLIDFGIARTAAQTGPPQVETGVDRPNHTDAERGEGQPANRNTDVYSLGVILWELLTQRPYTGAGTPPSEHNPAIIPDLDRVVERALHRDRDKRFESAGAFRQALSVLLPSGYDGEKALRELLAGKYDIARERRLRKQAIIDAFPLLNDRQRIASSTDLVKQHRGWHRVHVFVLAGLGFALAFVMVLVGLVLGGFHKESEMPSVSPKSDTFLSKVVTIDASAPIDTIAPLIAPPLAVAEAKPSIPEPRVPTSKTPRHKNFPSSEDLLKDVEMQIVDGDLSRALRLARLAVKAGGGASAHIMIGRLLVKMDRLKAAAAEFRKALANDPDNDEARKRLAHTLDRISEQEDPVRL
jgi:serine/threonine protein kinase